MPKQMSREQRAAYMREYRARRKREDDEDRAALVADEARYAGADWGRFATLDEFEARARSALKPSFLAAPNDDCAACGHDRQQFHVTGPCTAPNGRRRCSCPDFVAVLFDD